MENTGATLGELQLIQGPVCNALIFFGGELLILVNLFQKLNSPS